MGYCSHGSLTPAPAPSKQPFASTANHPQEIRDITAAVAAEVIKVAALQGHASGDVLEPLARGDEQLRRWIRRRMFYP